MRSIRLPDDIERRLQDLSERENRSKSDLIKEAIVTYLADRDVQVTPFEAGLHLFGRYGSGGNDPETSTKERIKEKIRAKHARR
jgi:Arc/MetJ-type ribon-helix-helix transcriptional regulator